MALSKCFLVLLLAFHVFCTQASIHLYRSSTFSGNGNAFVLHGGSEGLYAGLPVATNDNESTIASSFIRLDKIIFRRPEEAAALSKYTDTMLVQALVFEIQDRERIGGSAYGGQRAVCCTPDLAKLGVCIQDTIIYRPSTINHGWPKVFQVEFKGKDVMATLPSRTIEIPRTGMYNLYFIHCDPRLDGTVVNGHTTWKSPNGYLPGRMAPLMKFYALMCLSFLMLGLFWSYQYIKYWKEILPLQNCVTLVLVLGTSEMMLWYLEFAGFNKYGVRPIGITVWVVTIETIKRTVSRVLVLVVSMGYGVVRPTLGGLTSKVIMLGVTFFCATEVLELVEHAGAVSDLSGNARLLLVLPIALLDAFFVIWIFVSLSNTLDKLQVKRLTLKLEVYRKFTNALVVAFVVSLAWIGYEIYFKSVDIYNERWQIAWVIPAFWQVLTFSLLCIICTLWAPSQNSMRFAYSRDDEDFDNEDATLMKTGPSHSNGNRGF